MKNAIVVLTGIMALLISLPGAAQKFPPLDKSPADIVYLRADDNSPVARVIYSRPQKKDRDVYGKLAPYGKLWRTGANEATEIEFFRDVEFGGQAVKAGAYALFSIPDEKEWTVILNTVLHQWGAYAYDEAKDAVRVKAASQNTPKDVETFTITFHEGNLVMAWGEKMVAVPVK